MNFILRCAAGLLIALSASLAFAQANQNLPHLEKRGNATQLIVDGKPFLMLGGELYNSSSSSMSYMEPIWPRLTALHVNTVLTPVSWELIEPQEGKYNFSIVDGLISAAHQHNLRLVFLWFGSWKNTYSSYVPEWVKRDTKRFPRVLLRDGRPTERLTPLSSSNRNADAKVFAALMKHVSEVDTAHTVLMVQVENEVGVIPESRDFSPEANAAFNSLVPKPLLDYMQKHSDILEPELRAAWIAAGKKTSGTWQEVFGKAPITDDFFMAWQYATYIDAVAAAGKAGHAIPMYTNAALIRPNYQPGQYNSGGPLPHSMDIYRAAAPHLDFLSPDIYFDDFAYWAGRYQRDGNAVFVPEAHGGLQGAANAFFAFGQLDAIGFSPFGIDGKMSIPGSLESVREPIAAAYSLLDRLGPQILQKQGTDQLAAIVLEGREQRSGRISFGGYNITVNWPGAPGANDRAGVLFLQTGADEFLVAGAGAVNLSFTPNSEGLPIAGIASIDEDVLVDGKWTRQRRLNGDENGQGQILRLNPDGSAKPVIYTLRLYRY